MSGGNNNNWNQQLQDEENQKQYYKEEKAEEVFIREKYKESNIRPTRWTNEEDPVKYEYSSASVPSEFQGWIKNEVEEGQFTETNKTKWVGVVDGRGQVENETLVVEESGGSGKIHATFNSYDGELSGSHITYEETKRKRHNVGLEDPDLVNKMVNYGASGDDINFARNLQDTHNLYKQVSDEKQKRNDALEKEQQERLNEWYDYHIEESNWRI